MYKYLYGTKSGLKKFIDGRQGLRFTDIAHLKNCENKKSRDNEDIRNLNVPLHRVGQLEFGKDEKKIIIPRSDIVRLSLGQPTRRCHVRCFSNSGFNPELFDYFEADICLEINVQVIIDMINETFIPKKGGQILAKDVTYTDDFVEEISLDGTNLVFVKPEKFRLEDEFRLALFYPYDDKTHFKPKANPRQSHPMFGGDPYFELGYSGKHGLSFIIRKIVDRNGKELLDRGLDYKIKPIKEHRFVNGNGAIA
jgi:hypothetical protein